MSADLRAVLFDVDDTLFDRNGAQLMALDVIAREFRDLFAGVDRQELVDAFLESDRLTTLEFYGDIPTVKNIRVRRAQVFLDLLGLDGAHADALAELYVEVYPRMDAPVDGAAALVEALAPRFQLGVVSNSLPDVQYQKLATLGIRHFFECIVLSEEFGIRKPDPAIFWHAAGLLGREPEECLYVGDSYTADVVGAKRAGLPVCWFNPNGLHPPQVGVECDFEVRTLAQVCEILNEVEST
ncbi:MAG: HAD family hydrolase [Anaerolineae bacterium]|nr:HAD family hydrolase [Anaerolineae bacterium]